MAVLLASLNASAEPTITYCAGKLLFACQTQGVDFVYTIVPTASSGENTYGVANLGTTFNVSVYAKRHGYKNSDAATLVVNMPLVGDMNEDGIISVSDVTSLVNVLVGKDNTKKQ